MEMLLSLFLPPFLKKKASSDANFVSTAFSRGHGKSSHTELNPTLPANDFYDGIMGGP